MAPELSLSIEVCNSYRSGPWNLYALANNLCFNFSKTAFSTLSLCDANLSSISWYDGGVEGCSRVCCWSADLVRRAAAPTWISLRALFRRSQTRRMIIIIYSNTCLSVCMHVSKSLHWTTWRRGRMRRCHQGVIGHTARRVEDMSSHSTTMNNRTCFRYRWRLLDGNIPKIQNNQRKRSMKGQRIIYRTYSTVILYSYTILQCNITNK